MFSSIYSPRPHFINITSSSRRTKKGIVELVSTCIPHALPPYLPAHLVSSSLLISARIPPDVKEEEKGIYYNVHPTNIILSTSPQAIFHPRRFTPLDRLLDVRDRIKHPSPLVAAQPTQTRNSREKRTQVQGRHSLPVPLPHIHLDVINLLRHNPSARQLQNSVSKDTPLKRHPQGAPAPKLAPPTNGPRPHLPHPQPRPSCSQRPRPVSSNPQDPNTGG